MAVGGTNCAALIPRKACLVLPPSPLSWHPTQPLLPVQIFTDFHGGASRHEKEGPKPHLGKPRMGKNEATKRRPELPTLALSTTVLTADGRGNAQCFIVLETHVPGAYKPLPGALQQK